MKKFLLSGIILIIIISIAGITFATTCNYIPRVGVEEKKEIIDTRVEQGKITEEQAKEIVERLENCDGTRQEKIGQEYNVYFGLGAQNNDESTQANRTTNENCQYNGECNNQEECSYQSTGIRKQQYQQENTGMGNRQGKNNERKWNCNV